MTTTLDAATALESIIPESRTGANSKGIRTYSHTYRVTSDSQSDGVYTVGSTAGLPLIGDQHYEDSAAYLTDLTPRCVSGYKIWEVDATYSTERVLANDPEDDEILISYNGEIYQLPMWVDQVTGKPATNSAGDYFLDPSLMTEKVDLIATINVNLLTLPQYAIDLQNHVSNSAITISDSYSSLSVPKGLAKYGLLTRGNVLKRNDKPYYAVQIDIHLRKDGWLTEPLDAGFRERDYEGNLVQIRNPGDDEEVTSPAPLDGAGHALADPSPTNNVILGYNKHPIGDLTVLPGIS